MVGVGGRGHFVCKREEICLEPCTAMHAKWLLNSTPGAGCYLCSFFTAPSWGHIAIDFEHKFGIFCSSL